ncbi:LOW QUALITY PROTEIN: F-box/LRR-repeat protein At4g29420 [Coffea eugenioides]|uniref:LOW QUALITY PROTEIN: F-box/LRR-repeat protein At4g29420 n=1 Tax=Coffea eugenioides TaxID=49369 RepID=UPI000F612A29|nr:LOW QUALITY PROTEIN: F-box/LRR-repeat protein At4g29420 [Coffea eugenioides]
MDDLPPPLILDVLSRLGDSADLARCRVASKTFNSLSRDIRSINLHCSFDRYAKSRCPLTRSSITPFKTILKNLVSELRIVESVTIGIDKPLRTVSYDDVEDEDDDLYLTEVNFVGEWLPKVSDGLTSFSISDFWVQSCWRRSEVLSLISSYCHKLAELQIRNAWLSVDGLKPMPKLSKLTLEYIRLDDEDLNKVNESFPGLQVLNLIGVGGLKDPKIHLLQLKACRWTVSNAVYSVTIVAPNLVKLKLKCVRPRALVIETPSLADLHLSVEEASSFKVEEFVNLTNLHLESLDLRRLLCSLPFGKTVKNLKLGLTKSSELMGVSKFGFESLFSVFPNVSSLTFTPWAWSVFEMYICPEGDEIRSRMKGLKEITAYLEIHDFETTLSCIFSILDNCSNLFEMKLFIHRDVVFHVTNTLISRCMTRHPRVIWRWGMWKEGTEDAWILDGVL